MNIAVIDPVAVVNGVGVVENSVGAIENSLVNGNTSSTKYLVYSSTPPNVVPANVTFRCGYIPSKLVHVNLLVTPLEAVTVGVFGNESVDPSKVC